jgi:proline dehydrogenase
MISLSIFDNTGTAFQYRSGRELAISKVLFSSMASPFITKTGIALTKTAINFGLPVRSLIKVTLFRQFCGGESLSEAIDTADRINHFGVSAILDYGVEQKHSEEEFDVTKSELIKAIECAAANESISFIAVKISGLCRFDLLEKLHEGKTLTDRESEEWQHAFARLREICEIAAHHKVSVLIDAEETWIQNPVNTLTEDVMERFNKTEVIVYNTFQLYGKGALQFLKDSLQQAQEKGYLLGAKLVRGAYMEKERERARLKGYPDPIQPNKEATDQDFDEALAFCLGHLDQLSVFIGTHNEESCYKAIRIMEQHHIRPNHPAVFFSQLYGMSDHISFNMASEGYNVAKYLPYGPVKDVIPYLMRRAEENTSVAGQSGRELSLVRSEIKRRQNLTFN